MLVFTGSVCHAERSPQQKQEDLVLVLAPPFLAYVLSNSFSAFNYKVKRWLDEDYCNFFSLDPSTSHEAMLFNACM